MNNCNMCLAFANVGGPEEVDRLTRARVADRGLLFFFLFDNDVLPFGLFQLCIVVLERAN